MINFRDFAWALGVICGGELVDRLKLLYRQHLPPALLPTDVDDTELEAAKSGELLKSNSLTGLIVQRCPFIRISYFLVISV